MTEEVSIANLPIETIISKLDKTAKAELWVIEYMRLHPGPVLPDIKIIAAGAEVSMSTAGRAHHKIGQSRNPQANSHN